MEEVRMLGKYCVTQFEEVVRHPARLNIGLFGGMGVSGDPGTSGTGQYLSTPRDVGCGTSGTGQ